MSNNALTVAILGPGGVGGLLAALLARAGNRVICVSGEATAETLRTNGIHVRSSQFGDFTVPVEAATELREPVDACLIAVKHTALESALDRIPPAALGNALLVPLLNGVEHPALLRTRYPADQVAPAVIRVESTRTAPGFITHGSPFTELDLTSDTVPHPRLTQLAETLTAAGPKVQILANEPAVLWAKMSFLAPLALLTTRYALPLGDIRTHHREELITLVAETIAVARAHGAHTDPTQVLARYDAFLPTTKSSMQRDAEAGHPLELNAIAGALHRAATHHHIPIPVATNLIQALNTQFPESATSWGHR